MGIEWYVDTINQTDAQTWLPIIANVTHTFMQEMFDHTNISIDVVSVKALFANTSMMVASTAGTTTRRDFQSSGIDREGLLGVKVKGRNPIKADFLQAARESFRSDYGQDLYLEMLKDYVYENITSFSFDGATSLSDSLIMSPSASPTDTINDDDLYKENEHMFPSSSPTDLLETTLRLAGSVF